MSRFDELKFNPSLDPAEIEFTVGIDKYRLLIPKQYLIKNHNVWNYIWDNFDNLAQPGADFAIPNVDFDKIANEE